MVGSTDDVSGSTTVAGMTVAAVPVVVHTAVHMAAVRCGCVHDAMHPRPLETGKRPTSTFDLTSPIDISAAPAADSSTQQICWVRTYAGGRPSFPPSASTTAVHDPEFA